MSVNGLKNICDQLDIDTDLMESDPKEFILQVNKKAAELATMLKQKNTLADIESSFKQDSYRNEEAKDQAALVYDQIMDLLLSQEPEVLANLLPKFSGMTEVVNNNVRSMAIRQKGRNFLNKKQLHLMYTQLKRTYDLYVEFAKVFNWIEKAPIIPAISGNYGTEGSNVKTYLYYLDGEELINPYTLAKRLNCQITHYMDIIDIIDKADGTIGGHKVTYKEI